ncbi:MAG: hypothetical protein HYZ26_10845 [Chloroflexi bacterium]|nr:hypothetical protein [Chloroflexota bacterium]
MKRRLSLALSIALLAASLHPFRVHAHPQGISISVGQFGFEGAPDFAVEVEAGHEVTLTFIYADLGLASDNPHIIRIEGLELDLPDVVVSRENPRATITFIATETGTLRILCIVPCVGMERLVGGQIRVVKPRATGAASILTITLEPRNDGSVLARVSLMDARGNPMRGVPIVFSQSTSVGGVLDLGAPVTMDDGSAVMRIPAAGNQEIWVTASFEGGNGLAYAETSARLAVTGTPMEHPLGALSSPAPPLVLALTLLVVLGGIWATYGYVFYQVGRIGKEQ